MSPIRLTEYTAKTQTADWIARSRKVIVKFAPETTYYGTSAPGPPRVTKEGRTYLVDDRHGDTSSAISQDGEGYHGISRPLHSPRERRGRKSRRSRRCHGAEGTYPVLSTLGLLDHVLEHFLSLYQHLSVPSLTPVDLYLPLTLRIPLNYPTRVQRVVV